METHIYKIQGMHCASCAATIQKTLLKLPGVAHAEANFGTEKLTVHVDPTQTNPQLMSDTLKPLGYSLVIEEPKVAGQSASHSEDHAEHGKANTSELPQLRTHVMVSIPLVVLSAAVMTWEIIGGMSAQVEEVVHHLMPLVATYMLFVVGKPFLLGLWRLVRYGKSTMDTLIGLGTTAAFVYSFVVSAFEEQLQGLIDVNTYYDVTIIVIGFIIIGKYLEAKAKLKTGDAIQKLLSLQVKTAHIIRDGVEIEVQIAEVVHGDQVVVRPGEKIAVDGVIVKGGSHINESMITGESMPVQKGQGDTLIAGTVNEESVLTFTATGIGNETVLARIIGMVEQAQGSRAPIQKLADTISAVFVPVVLGIAVLTFILWVTIGAQFMPVAEALVYGLVCFVTILVIACPCALGLATPTGIIVGVGKGAQAGIFIKNAEALEKLYGANTLLVDKTGTLTNGKPILAELRDLSDRPETEILMVLAALEHGSEHPIAHAIQQAAKEKKITLPEVDTFLSVKGKGVQGNIQQHAYFLGNQQFIQESLGIVVPEADINAFASQGLTAVVLADAQGVLAIAAVGDTIRSGAKQAVSTLQSMGIEVIMATGDHVQTATAVANQLGIKTVLAQLLPEDKQAKVKQLQSQGRIVAVAGDGVNDAPALAQADISLAMSTGTDIAIETADITLLHGDIAKITQAIRISQLTMRTIKQNLFWAFVYNIVGIPLAAGVLYPIFGWLLNPIFAGLAMALSSVSVVGNSLRLKAKRI